MDDDRMRRLRAYVMSANAIMGKIPTPVPPKPKEGWDAPTFDTREMYVAFSELPADLQELAATSHVLCENALQAQRGAALRALTARYAMMVNVVQTTELAHELDALYEPQPVHEYLTLVDDEVEDEDEDEVTAAEVQRDVDAYVRGLLMERERANAAASQAQAAETGGGPEITMVATPAVAAAVEPPVPASRVSSLRMVRAWAASASVVAALCAGLLIWHHAGAPAPVAAIHPINQSIQAGDVGMVVNYAHYTENATEVHVQMINFSSEPAPATFSLDEGDLGSSTGPLTVPAKSMQHRVLRVRKDRSPSKKVRVQLHAGEDVVSIEL